MNKPQLKVQINAEIKSKTQANSISPTTLGTLLDSLVDNLSTQEEVTNIKNQTTTIISTEAPSGVAVDGAEWVMYR